MSKLGQNTQKGQPQTATCSGSASLLAAKEEKSRGFLSHPRHLLSTQHRDMLVFRIVPVVNCPQPRWEKWTALADSEEIAREVIFYHFPGHMSIESTDPRQ